MKRAFSGISSLLAVVLALAANSAVAAVLQVSGEPAWSVKEDASLQWRMSDFPASYVGRVILNEVPLAQLAELENYNRRAGIKATQIGVARDASALSQPSLRWVSLAGGGAVARIEVQSPDAQGVRVGLQLTGIAASTELRFAGSAEPSRVVAKMMGAEVKQLADADQVYWTPATDGEQQLIELYAPAGLDTGAISLMVAQVSHLVTNSRSNFSLVKAIGDSGSCNVDTACRIATLGQAFTNAKNAVARMVFVKSGSSYTCTGTLLNDNVDGSQIPYFYSADHCINDQAVASTLNTYWGFEATSCGSGVAAANTLLSGGAQYLYSDNSTDALLLRLNNAPPNGSFFAGWDASVVSASASVLGIHHPRSDLKKSSLGQQISNSSTSIEVGWTSGTTEGGSSGSGLFTSSNGGYFLRGGLEGAVQRPAATAAIWQRRAIVTITRAWMWFIPRSNSIWCQPVPLQALPAITVACGIRPVRVVGD